MPTGMPELEFPKNEQGEFVNQEELQRQEDEKMIQEISNDTKAMPHLIKKNEKGEWTVNGMSIEAYKELWSGNDNSEMYKK